jgi:NAD(P)-dependent dehydrogenase (short-subunit alcohol dehydrogenase family)
MNRLKDKVAIVTGGGSGIGRGIAQMFAAEGARVAVADLVAEGGQETVRLIREAGGQAHFVQVNVTVAAEAEALAQSAVREYDRVDILVNSAGIAKMGTVTETDEAVWEQVLGVDLKGVYLCSRYALPEMIRAGGGAVVNIASVAALLPAAEMAAYSAAKAAVLNLTKQMAVDYGPKGIRVNCICPGTIPTPMHYLFYSPEEQEKVLAEWAALKPLRKVGKVEDIAYAATYLASDEASFVTGANLVVDGGTTASGSG